MYLNDGGHRTYTLTDDEAREVKEYLDDVLDAAGGNRLIAFEATLLKAATDLSPNYPNLTIDEIAAVIRGDIEFIWESFV